MSENGTCSACKAPLLWIRSAKSGKPVPCNTTPQKGIPIDGKAGSVAEAKGRGHRVVRGYTTDGRNVVVEVGPAPSMLGLEETIFETHFTDCPERASFRRR